MWRSLGPWSFWRCCSNDRETFPRVESSMTIHPLAGKPAPKDVLVDIDKLRQEYYARKPDFADRGQRVSFGTSGHRGSSLRGSFNEIHVLAITQAICDYRQSQDISGPLYIGKDTHALSEPAFMTALEVLAANGVETMIDGNDGYTQPRQSPTPFSHSTLGEQQILGTASSSRPRTIRPKMAASSITRPAADLPIQL